MWWKKKEDTLTLKENGKRTNIFREQTTRGIKRANFKALGGRGWKWLPWVTSLYADLRFEFGRLIAVGLKFSASVLQTNSLFLGASSEGDFPYSTLRILDDVMLTFKMTPRWIHNFMVKEKLFCSPKQEN